MSKAVCGANRKEWEFSAGKAHETMPVEKSERDRDRLANIYNNNFYSRTHCCQSFRGLGRKGEHGVLIQTQQQSFIGCSSRDSAQGSGSPRLDQDDRYFLQSLDEECITKSIILSVKHITPHCQDVFRECCVTAMSRILDDKADEAAWKLFFLIPRFLLQPIRRGGKSGNKELERRFKLFREEKWSELYRSTEPRSHTAKSLDIPGQSESDLPDHLLSAVRNKVKAGEISRAANLLTSSGLAPDTKDTLEQLQIKHPPCHQPIDLCLHDHGNSIIPLQVSQSTFVMVLNDCPNGSISGFDGWRFEHLKLL